VRKAGGVIRSVIKKLGISIITVTILAVEVVNAVVPLWPHYTGVIIPCPQKVKYFEEFHRIEDLDKCVIIVGTAAVVQEKVAAEELARRIEFHTGTLLNIMDDKIDTSAYSTVITIGTPGSNAVNKRFNNKKKVVKPGYPGEQGYILRFVEESGKMFVICTGYDAMGSYYSIQSLKQLLLMSDGKLSVRKVEVDDWPVYKHRAVDDWTLSSESVDWMGQYKLNVFYNSYGPLNWLEPDGKIKEYVALSAGNIKKKMIVEHGFMLNPYKMKEGDTRKIVVSNDGDIEKYVQSLKSALDLGVKYVMICADDWVTYKNKVFILDNPGDINKFGTLGNAQAVLVNAVYDKLKPLYPVMELSFVNAYYQRYQVDGWTTDRKSAVEYLDTIGKKVYPQIPIIWTGYTDRTRDLTKKEVEIYSRYVKKHKLYLWDNTLPQGFKPWVTKFYPGFEKVTAYRGVMVNGFVNRSNDRIGYLMAADYMWNPAKYEPEKSYKNAISSYLNEVMYEPITKFRDTYEKYGEIKKRMTSADKDVIVASALAREEMRQVINELSFWMKEISRNISGTDIAYQVKIRFYEPAMKFGQLYLNRKSAVVKKLGKEASPPVIDGSIDDIWNSRYACTFTSFSVVGSPVGGTAPVHNTLVKLMYDDKYIYIMSVTDVERYEAEKDYVVQRDSSVYLNDSIELFIDPLYNFTSYYQLVYNFMGGKYDAQSPRRMSWNANWDVKTSTQSSQWVGEARILITGLVREGIKIGDAWGLNVCRNDTISKQFSSWSPLEHKFHEPLLFGEIRFEY